MFDAFIKKKAEVSEHWIAFADNFQCIPSEFYTAVEDALKARQISGLAMSRIEFAEGGVLSAHRVYLRMLRERLVFDVCAAPFGTRFFFSCRAAEIPLVIEFWPLLVIFAVSCIIGYFLLKAFGIFYGPLALIAAVGALIYVLRNAVSIGLRDLDTALIRTPGFGPIYERFFRKETYYRIDSRLMYLDTVSNIVKNLAEEVAAAKGIKLTREFETAPLLGELYRKLPPRPSPPASVQAKP